MITYNPLLCLDFYKTCHAEQYPKGLTKMVSYAGKSEKNKR